MTDGITPSSGRTFVRARRTAAAVPCIRCGREYTKTLAGRGRCRSCVEAEAAIHRRTHCANCGLEKQDETECVYMRPFHLGTFEVNPESSFWDTWTDQMGSPDTDKCKAEYGKEGGYVWSGCGCTMGPEKDDECEVKFESHADWPENHPLNCEECDVKTYYCQRDTENFRLDQEGFYDAQYDEGDEHWQGNEGDEGDFEGDEGDYQSDYGDEGDERTAGYDGEEDPEDEFGPDDEAGLSPDEEEEHEEKKAATGSAKTSSLGGSAACVRAIWVLNKGGNTQFDEDAPSNSLPTIITDAKYSPGAPNSPFVEKLVSVDKLQEWCAAQGYEPFPTRLCSLFGVSLRCFARPAEAATARTPINVVATHLNSDSIEQLNDPVFGRALVIRYDANGNPVDLPREEFIRVLSFVNDIYQMLFDSLEPSPELLSAWKQCFPYYDPSNGDSLMQDQVKGNDGRLMNGTTGERTKMELVDYQSRLREREGGSPSEGTADSLPNLDKMSLQEAKNTEGTAESGEDAVKFHTNQGSATSSASTSLRSTDEKSVFPAPGARCVIHGLKKKPQLNGCKGEIIGPAAGGRWTVRVVTPNETSNSGTHDLLPDNFTQDSASTTAALNSTRVVELAPVGASAPLASIPLTETFLDCPQSEDMEKIYLKSKRGWKDPQSLETYSVRGEYRDLIAYYDAEDETSPLNELAMKAFCGYKKVTIRGPVFISRAQPPIALNFGQPFGSGPMPTVLPSQSQELNLAELRETLAFYTTNDVRKVVQQRDYQRASSSFKKMQS